MLRYEEPGIVRAPAFHSLARAIQRHVYSPGDYATAIPALSLHRRDAPTEPVPCLYSLSLVVTAQGEKQVMVSDRVVNYGPGRAQLTTIDMPLVSHVTRATSHEPYLGLLLKLDARALALAASEMKLRPERRDGHPHVSIENVDPALGDALLRLIVLLDEPALLSQLAPLVQQEIVVRLLVGPHGPHLRQLMAAEPPSQQIARVVAWMKQNFANAVRVNELAAKANMSASTFRQHFRRVTGLSPVQFQKQLRLQEARQLMLNQSMDAGQAAGLVGYQSASQFSRDYSRVFGSPPQRDVRRVRSS